MNLPNYRRAVDRSRRWLIAGRDRVTLHSRDLLDRSKQLLEWVVPDPIECRRAAQKLRDENPLLTDRQLAHLQVREARNSAAKVGGATGLLAAPWAMLTAAFGDAAYVLRLEGRLAGQTAALLDPKSLDSPDTFRADVLAIVFPSAASQALRAATNIAAEQASRVLVRRFMSREVTETAARLATRRLLGQFAERALTKAVPLAGIAVGAGWNWLEVRAVGRRAIDYYTRAETPPALPPPPLPEP